MTFEKWWKENRIYIWQHGGLDVEPTIIKKLFFESWQDGFKTGFSSPNKLDSPESYKQSSYNGLGIPPHMRMLEDD